MALFGDQSKEFSRAREVDSGISERAICLQKLVVDNEEQVVADVTVTNLALAIDKNNRVMDIASVIAEESSDVFIVIPPATEDGSEETYLVRNALIDKYQVASENGTIVRYELFKDIVDRAAEQQTSVVAKLTEVGDFNAQINEIKISGLSNILNGSEQLDDFVTNKELSGDSKINADEKALWKSVGVAFLSFALLSQFHKISALFTSKEDLKKVNEDSTPLSTDTPAEKVSKISSKLRKVQRIIIKVAEAVVLFALIHKLSKKQTRVLATVVVPPEVEPSLKEQFFESVNEIYDNPPSDISALLLGNSASDELILTYIMKRIDIEKEQKNFTPWITYAIGKVRDLNLANLDTSLAGTSNEGSNIDKIVGDNNLATGYSSPSFSVEREIVKTEGIGSNIFTRRPGIPGVSRPLRDDRRDLEFSSLIPSSSPINKYLPDQGGHKIGFNIMDYIYEVNDYSATSGSTSDYYMHLLHNNRYTPELVCCLLKFLADDLDFLKNLKGMLEVFGKGIGFRWGDLLNDIVNSLFTDLRSKILSFALGEVAKLMAKVKKPIIQWIERTLANDEYLAFCTPIIDMARILLRVINEFEILMRDMIEDIINSLMDFELKIEGGVIEMHSTTRYNNIKQVLSAIIDALENGRLCNQDDFAPTDIHPDAVPIIEALGAQPRINIEEQLKEHEKFSQALRKDGVLSGREDLMAVDTFKDPDDPLLKTAVSFNRVNTGESSLETISKYLPRCGAFRRETKEFRQELF